MVARSLLRSACKAANMQSYGFGWAVKLMVRITLIMPSSPLKMTGKLIMF
jgi:hypothetical protein